MVHPPRRSATRRSTGCSTTCRRQTPAPFTSSASASGIACREVIDVGHELAARDEPEVDVVEVRDHGDVESAVVEDRAERMDRDELGTREIERPRRTGHVRHDQVDDGPQALADPEPRVEAHRAREQRRGGRLGPVLQRRVRRPPRAHCFAPAIERATARRVRPDRRSRPAGREHRRDPVAELTVVGGPHRGRESTRPAACREARLGSRGRCASHPR